MTIRRALTIVITADYHGDRRKCPRPWFFQSTNTLLQMQSYSGPRARLLRLGHVRRTGIPDYAVSPTRPARTNCTIERVQ